MTAYAGEGVDQREHLPGDYGSDNLCSTSLNKYNNFLGYLETIYF